MGETGGSPALASEGEGRESCLGGGQRGITHRRGSSRGEGRGWKRRRWLERAWA